MEYVMSIVALLAAYLIGSIPTGLLIVRLKTGKDVRTIESGRTGGTNAMRAAGFWAGFATSMLDILKAAVTVWLARWLAADVPWLPWLEVLAPTLAIAGHNYSIYLIERSPQGKLRLRGGAGGSPCVGGSLGLWAPSILIVLPLGAVILYFVGYASVATLSAAVLAILIFGIRAALGYSSWVYVLYGVFSLALLAWALRPNLVRLLNGTERLTGYRAKKQNNKKKPA